MKNNDFYFIEITKESIKKVTDQAVRYTKKRFYRHCISAIVLCVLLIVYYPTLSQTSVPLTVFAILLLLDNMVMTFLDLHEQRVNETNIPTPSELKSCLCEDMQKNSRTILTVANGVAMLTRELTETDYKDAAQMLEHTIATFGNKETLQYIKECLESNQAKEMGYLLTQLLQVALDDNQFSILDKGSAMADHILIREV